MATPPDGTFSELDAESWYACAVRTTGALVCWGQPPGDVAWDAHGISAGGAHTCAFRIDGELSCWGNNDWGQIFPPVFQTFTAVSAGWMHTCGIRTDQTVACWGLNDDGQASPPAGEFVAISAGETHSCGIRSDGTLSCWGSNQYGESGTAGTAVMSPLATFASTSSIAVHWGARTGLADVATYDVRYRQAPRNAGFGAYATWLSATSLTSRTFSASPGYTYCYSVRVRDVDDHLSGWTADRCTAVPLDDRSLTRSSGWTSGTGTAYYRSTYLRASLFGARLTRTGVVAKRIALLATTCATCGSVKVYWGSTLLKTVNLYSRTTVNKKLITVATFTSARSGTLSIKVSSSGKKVIIDGVAIRRN